MKTITVKVKSVYGVNRVYPVSDNAVLFAQLAGTITLSKEALNLINSLGYLIETETKDVTELLEFKRS